MDVQQYLSADLPADLVYQIASFVRIVWLANAQGEDRFWPIVEPADGEQHFVIAERGVLISHANVLQRATEHKGSQYQLCGLGGVFTYPAFRGEGYARQVVDAATAFIRSSGADIAMLFCEPHNEALYARSGWQPLRIPGVYFGSSDQPQLYDEETVMMQFCRIERRHGAAILRINRFILALRPGRRLNMYDLEHYTSNALPPDIASQIRTFYRLLLLDESDGEARFEDPFTHAKTMEHFMIVERGVLISHADVSERTITHRGETYRLCGIGEVMTNPNFRHEGHGQRVVSAATDYIRSTNVDIGMLFTGTELEAFYNSSGWVALSHHAIAYGDPAQPRSDDEFIMMLFISEKAKAHRADFERGPIYVGQLLW